MEVAARIDLADLTAELANASAGVEAWAEAAVSGAAAARAAHAEAVAGLEGKEEKGERRDSPLANALWLALLRLCVCTRGMDGARTRGGSTRGREGVCETPTPHAPRAPPPPTFCFPLTLPFSPPPPHSPTGRDTGPPGRGDVRGGRPAEACVFESVGGEGGESPPHLFFLERPGPQTLFSPFHTGLAEEGALEARLQADLETAQAEAAALPAKVAELEVRR